MKQALDNATLDQLLYAVKNGRAQVRLDKEPDTGACHSINYPFVHGKLAGAPCCAIARVAPRRYAAAGWFSGRRARPAP